VSAVGASGHRPPPLRGARPATLDRAAAVHVLVPVRGRRGGKQRLAEALPPPVRDALVASLLAHVLDVVTCHPRVRSCTIASPDRALEPWAWARGVRFRACRGSGLNADVAEALADWSRVPAPVMIVHGDLPYLDAGVIDLLLGAPAEVAIARSRDGGTNALALAHPASCPPRFGRDSARAHACAAWEHGSRAHVLDHPALAFDVDTVADACAWAGVTPDALARGVEQRLGLEPAT